jgi:WD40 repeat protein
MKDGASAIPTVEDVVTVAAQGDPEGTSHADHYVVFESRRQPKKYADPFSCCVSGVRAMRLNLAARVIYNRWTIALLGSLAFLILLTRVYRWDLIIPTELSRASVVCTLKANGRPYCLAFSPDSTRLAVGHADGTVKVWNMQSKQEWVTIPYKSINDDRGGGHSVLCITFGTDGKTIAWAGPNHPVTLFDILSKSRKYELAHQDVVECLSMSPDGAMVATGTLRGELQIWKLDKGCAATFIKRKLDQTIRSMAFDSTGKQLAIGVFGGVVLVNIINGKERRIADGYLGAIGNVMFGSTDQTVAANTGKVSIWDIEKGREIVALSHQTQGTVLESISFSPDQRTVAMASRDGVNKEAMLEFWDVTTQCQLGRLVYRGGRGPRCFVAWSPDGFVLATARRDAIDIWDWRELRERLSPARDLYGPDVLCP